MTAGESILLGLIILLCFAIVHAHVRCARLEHLLRNPEKRAIVENASTISQWMAEQAQFEKGSPRWRAYENRIRAAERGD